MPRNRLPTLEQLEKSMVGVNKHQDPEHTLLLARQSIGRRLVAANLGQLNIPNKPHSQKISSRDYEDALNTRKDQGTRRISALSSATSRDDGSVNKNAVRVLNRRHSSTPIGIYNTERIEHFTKEMLERRDREEQQESDNISRGQQKVANIIRRMRADEGNMRMRADEELRKEGWDGGYTKLTNGLLARIMNIKKKVAKVAKHKAVVRKAVKPTAHKPTKSTRPVVKRRRKPTGVRK